MTRTLTLPESYLVTIQSELEKIGRSLNEPAKLAHDVVRLSDHYTSDPLNRSPWREPWAQAASLAYYFPLNYTRARAVAIEAARLGFFEGLTHLADFGSGMGSALLAFRDELTRANQGESLDTSPNMSPDASRGLSHFQAYDISETSLNLQRALAAANREKIPHCTVLSDSNHTPMNLPARASLLFLASYVLTELSEVPEWWFEPEAIAIIEPSTQQDARRLMGLREEYIKRGYQVWAPCTHQGPCPLLHLSQKDWCHDRIHFAPPGPWWEPMESRLPMKNRTLTFSYLLARRTKAPPLKLKSLARLTGDRLEEKGKNRQSVCRGSRREFLAWFPGRLKKEELKALEFGRGILVELRPGLSEKGSEASIEVRVASPGDVKPYDPSTVISDRSNAAPSRA
jgi:hypothetical protein